MRQTIRDLAPRHRDNPRIVTLSEGTERVNSYEDSYLARYLGYTLAEGGDLAIRNNAVWLKTLGGLLPVDVILRRPNTADCDPLELRGESAAGVAGLLEASRQGSVALANPLGSGLVESPLFRAFLSQLCSAVFGEPLALPNPDTWWCGDPSACEHVLANLDSLSVEPAFRRRGRRDRYDRQTSADLAAAIQASPADFVASRRAAASTIPTWDGRQWYAGNVVVRMYAVAAGDDFVVMRGGLARVVSTPGPNWLPDDIQTGKDVWVVADGPVEQTTLLPQTGSAVALRRSESEFPSRVADNLYWLGRNVERADAAARLLRTTAVRLSGETGVTGLSELPVLLRTGRDGTDRTGLCARRDARSASGHRAALPAAVFEESQSGSLRSLIAELFRIASLCATGCRPTVGRSFSKSSIVFYSSIPRSPTCQTRSVCWIRWWWVWPRSVGW